MRHLPAGAPILTVAALRAAETAATAAGTTVDELVERAGLAVAREVRRFAGGRPVLVLAGPGTNGADAHVAARHLAGWGLDVAVAVAGPARDGVASRAAARWMGASGTLATAVARPVLVDGLLGIGADRPVAGELADALARLRAGVETVIAIDLPSGVAADGTGTSPPPLPAHLTVALGALKPAHLTGRQAEACGHVLLADLGLSPSSDWTSIAPPRLPPLPEGVQKFSRGMVVVVGGAMPGASLLAATSAMHGGAGYVVLAERAAGGEEPHALVRRVVADAAALEPLLADERVGAVAIGPGLGRDDAARASLDAALASSRPLIVDGDALSLLGRDAAARLAARAAPTLCTPHSGEFERMFGEDGGGKIERTLAGAAASRATIVHKGPDTVIATPDGRVTVLAGSSAWLSTAGSGDVLAGLVASRLAAGGEPLAAASEAAWLHARAAALAGVAFAADDLVRHLPAALGAVTRA